MNPLLPKYVQYFPDGSGRDSYINNNSGGFSRFFPSKVIPPHFEIIRPPLTGRGIHRDLSKTSWTFKYKSDGSGRDSYVLHGSGGLQNEYLEPKVFKETLRKGFFSLGDPKHIKGRSLSSSNSIEQFKTNVKYRYVSRDEYLISAKLRKIQDSVTNRLYKLPKKEEDLYGTYPYNIKNFGLTTSFIDFTKNLTKNNAKVSIDINKKQNLIEDKMRKTHNELRKDQHKFEPIENNSFNKTINDVKLKPLLSSNINSSHINKHQETQKNIDKFHKQIFEYNNKMSKKDKIQFIYPGNIKAE